MPATSPALSALRAAAKSSYSLTSSSWSSPALASDVATSLKVEASQASSATTATGTGSTVPSELRFANINMNIVESATGKTAPQTHVLGRRSSVLTVIIMVLNMAAP